jgi:hypothetical protein
MGYPDRDQLPGNLPVVPFALSAAARGIPKTCTPDKVRRHFQRAYGLFRWCSVVGLPFRYGCGHDSGRRCRFYRLHPSPGVGSDTVVLYALVKRQRLDSARWIVAIFALLSGTWYSFGNIIDQGVRFTHWTIGEKMRVPLFVLLGNSFGVQILLRTLLFYPLSMPSSVIRSTISDARQSWNESSRTLANYSNYWFRRLFPPSPASLSPAPTTRRRRSEATSSRSFPWKTHNRTRRSSYWVTSAAKDFKPQ